MTVKAKEQVKKKVLDLRRNLSEGELECLSLKHEHDLNKHISKLRKNRKASDRISEEDFFKSF